MGKKLPISLYHYSTIESLAMILCNKTIRFNNLVDLDDLEEGRSLDLDNPGRLTYASCWTKSRVERIPLWYMYSKNMEGVRIKLPTNPFGLEPKFAGNNIFFINDEQPLFVKANENNHYAIVHKKELIGDAFLRIDNDLEIEYTDDDAKIKPYLLVRSSDENRQEITILGRVKRSCWDFQEECRYIITVVPKIDAKQKKEKGSYEAWRKAYESNNMLSFKNLFLDIDEEAFTKMEIMMGPGVNEGQKLIIKNLRDKYNPKAKIIESKLTGKIRVKY